MNISVILRNINANSKHLSYCTKAWKSTYPGSLIVGQDLIVSRHGKGDRDSSLLCHSNLSKHNVLTRRRFHSEITLPVESRERDFHRSTDDRESIERTGFAYQGGGGGEEEENEIPISTTRKRRSRILNSKKIPVGEDVIQTLEWVFGMTRSEALKTVCSPKFFLVADAILITTLYRLKSYEIPSEQIQRAPWILLQPVDDVEKKISVLTDPFLFENYFEGIGFCHFPLYKIKHYQKRFESEWANFPNHNNRIYYLADKLSIPVDRLTEKIVKVQRLLNMKFHRVEMYIQLLINYGIRSEDILNDLWIFHNNVDLAEKRLKAIIDAGCKRPKLWMCRCPEDIFDRSLHKYQAEKDALGNCNSLTEYLRERLDHTMEDWESADVEFNAVVQNMCASKAKKILDLLFSEGYTTNEIKRSLRVLKYSLERTETRIKRLKKLGITFPITVLYKSPNGFESYIEAVMEAKEGS